MVYLYNHVMYPFLRLTVHCLSVQVSMYILYYYIFSYDVFKCKFYTQIILFDSRLLVSRAEL